MSEEPTVGPPLTAGEHVGGRDAPRNADSSATPPVPPPQATLKMGAGNAEMPTAAARTSHMPDLSMAGPVASGGASIHPLHPPSLDGYKVVARVGEGGMGTVWSGVQLSTRRNVAIKLISTAALASDRARQRFDREVEITARLEHPNIARVYDSGINRGVYFYAMELIDGVPLDQYVERERLGRREILELFAKVCRAVDHAHRREVIHRDLKPGNILVTRDGQPHVLDFGLAKALLQAGKEAGISLDGEIAGTPGFMAPEQAAGSADIDARCDVYSLGVILFRLLTGQSPHDLSGTYLDVLRRVSEEDPRSPRSIDRNIDRDVEALLLHAIDREPSQRYATAGVLGADVERYLAGDPITAKAPTTLYYLRKRVRKHRVRLATTCVVLVLIVAAALLTHRLVRSHRMAAAEARQKDINGQLAAANGQRAADNGRRAALVDADNSVLKGDQLFAAGSWNAARSEYLNAANLYRKAGASAFKAEAALWDLSRTAPPPLTTIRSPSAAPVAGAAAAPTVIEMSSAPAIFSDDRRMAAGYVDGAVRVTDLADGRILATLAIDAHPVRCVAVSSQGTLLLAGCDGGLLTLWSLESGRLVRKLSDPSDQSKDGVTRVAVSPDGRLALSVKAAGLDASSAADANDRLTLWDLETGAVLLRTNRAAGVLDVRDSVTQATFCGNARFATASAAAVVWDARDGKPVASDAHPATALACSPRNDQQIAVGASDGSIDLLDSQTGGVIHIVPRGSAVLALRFDPDGRGVLASTEDAGILHVALSGKSIAVAPAYGSVITSTISQDGRMAVTSGDESASTWELAPPAVAPVYAVAGSHAGIGMSSDGRLILTCGSRQGVDPSAAAVTLLDAATGQPITPANFPRSPCFAATLTRDGRTAAMLVADGLEVWSLDPPRRMRRFDSIGGAAANEPAHLSISDDGEKVAVCGNRMATVYRVGSGQSAVMSNDAGDQNTSVSLGGNGALLLSGGQGGFGRLYDANSGRAVGVLTGRTAPVSATALSRDGAFAVTGSGAGLFQERGDDSIRLWDVAGATLLHTWPSDGGRVRAVAISGDNRLIACASADASITLLDRESGQTVRRFAAAGASVAALCFDDSGQRLLCGGQSVCLFDFSRIAEAMALQDQAAHILAGDRSIPLTGPDALTLGRWFIACNENRWASAMCDQAATLGTAPPAVEVWRRHWKAGELDAAADDLNRLAVSDATLPAFYIKLCRDAIAAGRLKKKG